MISAQGSYLKYLPAIYSESDFMGRFLMIFESVLGPLESMIDNMAYYWDPGISPEELLPWLASWLGLDIDSSWPVERRRELVRSADYLFRCRGTRRALREFLRGCVRKGQTGTSPTWAAERESEYAGGYE